MSATSPTISGLGTATACGTCGELAQGVLPNGRRFAVTCPITEGVTMTVRLRSGSRRLIHGLPAPMVKTERALDLAADLLELGPVEIEVRPAGRLPVAKGMASSTADIVAAVRALAVAAGRAVDAPTLARLAGSIEPSDGVMFEGVAVIDPDSGERLRDWDWSPRFVIAMFVPTTCRVTVRGDAGAVSNSAAGHEALLADLDGAFARRDTAAVARLATRSAELNEMLVPNPVLPVVRAAIRRDGALGVCVGHSGTVCGLLFEDDAVGHDLAERAVARFLARLPAGTEGRVVRAPAAAPAVTTT